jgi:hypothetical protein
MDPYLEDNRNIWADLHSRLVTRIADALAPHLPSHYYVRCEQRAYVARVEAQDARRPDVAVMAATRPVQAAGGVGVVTAVAIQAQKVLLPRYEEVSENYLEIRDGRSHEVITAIEVLSPTNKARGAGRRQYEAKREKVLASMTGLVEIDLLRGGEPMEMSPAATTAYRVVVSAEWERPEARLYAFGVQDALPTVSVPLARREPEISLDFGPLLTAIYESGRYDLSVDYTAAPPEPALSSEDAEWLDARLRASGHRK